ncbi:uncharacterized protein F4807DRAFT_444586 [Annulohypoxylon truncatum]|uniref:uncharacterized protein n=1 Tax=Annulohypoxylon truncatum TaxID=327061 RepID=UPI002008808C|nr:uncharacterized protein F4807DRAFT_444586 [Annulohypoxylon truncatum]KAI1204977.1 hypothetical protein F4807DRAFT_444586 [Annulohypoxylon truncatum]
MEPPSPRQLQPYRGLDHLAPKLAALVVLSSLTKNVHAFESVSQDDWSHGTLLLEFWTTLPDLPSIVTEWVALIPLTVYLSNMRTVYDLAGEVSLRAKLSVSFVPKLWELGSIAKLLREREVFLDNSSSMGDPLRVYDVQWGSVFPCYNSAAAVSVAVNASRTMVPGSEITQEDLNNWIIAHEEELVQKFPRDQTVEKSLPPVQSEVYCGDDVKDLVERKRTLGRTQYLNIIYVPLREKSALLPDYRQRPWVHRSKVAAQILLAVVTGSVLLSLGCIGTGVILLIGAVSHYCAQHVQIKRSPLYLRNREVHQGCMLVAAHENATIWTLYLGDRGMIDSLLNKPMVEICKTNPIVLNWFQFAEILQVLAMTYVAGQRGWDALCLLMVILLWSLTRFNSRHKHAETWLQEEGFSTRTLRCEFPGRSELLGAVQLLSTEHRTLWMDGILAPVKRRDVWLEKIGAVDSDPDSLCEGYSSLNAHDRYWVRATGMQTLAGYNSIKDKLSEIGSPYIG